MSSLILAAYFGGELGARHAGCLESAYRQQLFLSCKTLERARSTSPTWSEAPVLFGSRIRPIAWPMRWACSPLSSVLTRTGSRSQATAINERRGDGNCIQRAALHRAGQLTKHHLDVCADAESSEVCGQCTLEQLVDVLRSCRLLLSSTPDRVFLVASGQLRKRALTGCRDTRMTISRVQSWALPRAWLRSARCLRHRPSAMASRSVQKRQAGS